jgi:hypothetical protein
MTWTAAGYAGLAGIGVAIGACFVTTVLVPVVLSSYAVTAVFSVGFAFIKDIVKNRG